MQLLIVWMIFFSLLISLAPLAQTETVKLPEESQKADLPGPSAPETNTIGLLSQQSLSSFMEETGIENPITVVRKTAGDAARSVGRSLGQYIRGQYQQKKNEDLLQHFDEALFLNLSGLNLSQDERRWVVRKIQDVYIQDAESGKYDLDQQNFRDLPVIIKKEYAEIELSRTQNGSVPTYDLKGFLKTQWTVQNGMLNGPAVTYYRSGEIKYIDIYEDGRKLSRKKYDPEGRLEFEQGYDYQKTVTSQSAEKKESAPAPPAVNPPAVAAASIPQEEAPSEPAAPPQGIQAEFKEIQPTSAR